ncbi:hypothetical protein KY284_024160 [Solanum tuberosum]|nr:hypothetical protein KY284_024160 [Solanum tuberosum]
MSFVLITLRWYHGGLIEFGPPPKYIRGQVTEFLEVDVDGMSYFELRDYIKELGYTIDCEFFIKWDGLLVLVDNDKAPLELKFVPNVSNNGVDEESFNEASNPNNHPPTSTFPSNPTTSPSETSSTQFEAPLTTLPHPSTFPSNPTIGPSETFSTPFEAHPTIVSPPSTFPSNPTTGPSEISSTQFEVPLIIVSSPSTMPPPSPSTVLPPFCVLSSDPIIDHDPSDDEVEYELEFEGNTNEDIEVDNDVYQKYIDVRSSKRHFKRSQRRSRGTTSDQIYVDEKGPDTWYDETNIGIRKILVGKLGCDEPYYLSDKVPGLEIDYETGWGDGEEVDQVVHKLVRRKKTLNRVVFDETYEKTVWELGLVFGS